MRWFERPALLGVLLLALVALLAGIALHELWSLLVGLASGADRIDVNTASAGAAPAAAAIGIWAAILLGARLTERGERRAMRVSFACVPLIVLLPVVATPLADHVLAERGYERCRIEFGRRFSGSRYHRGAPEVCPGGHSASCCRRPLSGSPGGGWAGRSRSDRLRGA